MDLSSSLAWVSSRRSIVRVMSTEAGIRTRRGAPSPGASIADTTATRMVAGVLTGLLLTAVALPARRLGRAPEVRDSFPFSHYPMFSGKRASHYWVTHLLGERADGSMAPLHYSYLGTGGLNAVRRQVRRRVRAGDGQLLAERAAALVGFRGRVADRSVVRVHIVRGRYLVDPFMTSRNRDEFTSRLDMRGSAEVPGR